MRMDYDCTVLPWLSLASKIPLFPTKCRVIAIKSFSNRQFLLKDKQAFEGRVFHTKCTSAEKLLSHQPVPQALTLSNVKLNILPQPRQLQPPTISIVRQAQVATSSPWPGKSAPFPSPSALVPSHDPTHQPNHPYIHSIQFRLPQLTSGSLPIQLPIRLRQPRKPRSLLSEIIPVEAGEDMEQGPFPSSYTFLPRYRGNISPVTII